MEKRLKVIRSCFQSDNGYTVLICDEVTKEGRAVACSLSCVGFFLPITENRVFTADVEEVYTKKYGKQYDVKKFITEDPKDKVGIVDVILSCKLKGIGKVKATRIYEKYGKDTLKVLDSDFLRIREIPHMPRDLETPMQQWNNSRDIRTMISIIGNDATITQKKLLKIKKYFKENTIQIMKNQPYKVMDVHGIDFSVADTIAKNCDEYCFSYNDFERIKAAIKQSLINAMLEGHLYLFTSQIISKVSDITRVENMYVKNDEIKKCLNFLVKSGELVFVRFTNEFAFYLRANYYAEQKPAEKLVNLMYYSKEKVDESKIDSLICKQEKKNGIKLAEKQREAIKSSLINPVSIITGGPGRGKTTVINTLLAVYEDLFPDNSILLAAPTGRAARRMSETTNHMARTIHSALGLRSDEDINELDDLSLEEDLIIVDEMSMVDMKLFNALCCKAKSRCKLVFVGDKDQLSSVGAGNVFSELISSKIIPTTILDTPFRQSENDLVFINAEKINKGDVNIVLGETFKFIECSGEDEIENQCLMQYQSLLKMNGNDLDSIFMLSPFKRKSKIGTEQLNKTLQNTINKSVNKLIVSAYGKSFKMGDKVMQMKNIETDEGLALSNGDIGYIINVCVGTENDTSVTVKFDGIGIKEYSGRDDFDMLELAYASTIHKSQGSEAKTVIIPMSHIFKKMLKRNLIYTAVSRAKRNVIIIGSKQAFNEAVRNTNYDVRNTLFAWRLQMENKRHSEEYKQLEFV